MLTITSFSNYDENYKEKDKMPKRGNIKRLQRGELSRIDARRGRSTDVYIGPPGGKGAPAGPTDEALQKKTHKLHDENAKLQQLLTKVEKELEETKAANKKLQQDLADLRHDGQAMSEKLAATEARLEEAQEANGEPMKPVKGLRILSVEESNEADGLVRLDCKLKPTAGPLGDTAAIIIPYEELDKVFQDDDDTSEESPNGSEAESEG
jgi:hypothetical protein